MIGHGTFKVHIISLHLIYDFLLQKAKKKSNIMINPFYFVSMKSKKKKKKKIAVNVDLQNINFVLNLKNILFHDLERWCRGHPCDDKQGNKTALCLG